MQITATAKCPLSNQFPFSVPISCSSNGKRVTRSLSKGIQHDVNRRPGVVDLSPDDRLDQVGLGLGVEFGHVRQRHVVHVIAAAAVVVTVLVTVLTVTDRPVPVRARALRREADADRRLVVRFAVLREFDCASVSRELTVNRLADFCRFFLREMDNEDSKIRVRWFLNSRFYRLLSSKTRHFLFGK